MSVSSKLVSRLEAKEKQVVVTYGTSLTAEGGWVDELRDALSMRWPGLATVINSGECGMGSRWGLEHLDVRVMAQQPDTVFLEFAINDCVERFACSVDESRANLETMVDRILGNRPDCEIILMTMTPGDLHPPGHLSYRSDITAYYDAVREVARERDLVLMDHDPHWRALRQAAPAQFEAYVPDAIHSTEAGCSAMVTPLILASLGVCEQTGRPA